MRSDSKRLTKSAARLSRISRSRLVSRAQEGEKRAVDRVVEAINSKPKPPLSVMPGSYLTRGKRCACDRLTEKTTSVISSSIFRKKREDKSRLRNQNVVCCCHRNLPTLSQHPTTHGIFVSGIQSGYHDTIPIKVFPTTSPPTLYQSCLASLSSSLLFFWLLSRFTPLAVSSLMLIPVH
jgi:hypothetical protein